MKNFSLKSFAALSLLTIVTVFGAANAAAAQAPNLEVMTWQGNATPLVESPYTYTTRVKNVGNRTANNVTLTVEFPLTNTSPNRHILGKLTGVQTPQGTCSVVSNKIVCNFGNMNNNQIRQVSFAFEFQVATTAPTLKSTATTTSTMPLMRTGRPRFCDSASSCHDSLPLPLPSTSQVPTFTQRLLANFW